MYRKICEFKDCPNIARYGVLCEFHSVITNFRYGIKKFNPVPSGRGLKTLGEIKKKKRSKSAFFYKECKHIDCDTKFKTNKKKPSDFCTTCKLRINNKFQKLKKSQSLTRTSKRG